MSDRSEFRVEVASRIKGNGSPDGGGFQAPGIMREHEAPGAEIAFHLLDGGSCLYCDLRVPGREMQDSVQGFHVKGNEFTGGGQRTAEIGATSPGGECYSVFIAVRQEGPDIMVIMGTDDDPDIGTRVPDIPVGREIGGLARDNGIGEEGLQPWDMFLHQHSTPGTLFYFFPGLPGLCHQVITDVPAQEAQQMDRFCEIDEHTYQCDGLEKESVFKEEPDPSGIAGC